MTPKVSRFPPNAYGRAWPWLLAAMVLVAAGGAALWQWKFRAPAEQTPGAAGPGAVPGAGGPPTPGGPGARRFGGPRAVQPVSVERARRQDVRVTVNAIGSITAANTAIVRAQVSGVLQNLAFREGQQVKPGELLATIDPRAFQAGLNQAEGALARDQAQLANARVDLARYRDLFAKDAIPRQQLDTQESLLRQLEGTVRVDQAAVESARLLLSYTRVSAPIEGRVGLKQADLGNVVQPSDPNGIVTITQTRPIALVFSVPAGNVPQIVAGLKRGRPLPVEAWDRTGTERLAHGRVATLDNAIDPATDTVKVKALFANKDDALFPNQAVSVRLQLDVLEAAITVPQAAILRGAQGFYVYVVNSDKSVSTRIVKPGAVDGDRTAVQGKLLDGEQVVIDGVDRLREGALVEVIAADLRQRAGAEPPAGARRGRRGAYGDPGVQGAKGPGGGAGPAKDAGASVPGQASGDAAAGGERPRWMDRLPPELVEKLKGMTPEERREWFVKRRETMGKESQGK